MDKYYLLVEYYKSDNSNRHQELVECLRQNVLSGLFYKIICFTEETDRPDIAIDTIEWIQMDKRATAYELFTFINKIATNETDTNTPIDIMANNYFVVSNADIFYNNTLLNIPSIFEKYNTVARPLCMAITRHNIEKDDTYKLHTPARESQDCWVFMDDVMDLPDSDFHFGLPGCDNRLAAILKRGGYNVINPCNQIEVIHNHATEYRSYTSKDRIKGTYAFIDIFQG